jgi:hypothetical protein
VKLRALLVVGLLAGLFTPRWLPQPLHASCCCPEGMQGACSRTDAACSLKRCLPDGAAAISLSAPRLLLPAAQTLPVPSGGELLALVDLPTVLAPPDDPSDPPPRVRA